MQSESPAPMLTGSQMLRASRVVLTLGFCGLLLASWKLFHRAVVDDHLALWNLYWLIPLGVIGGWGKAHFVMRRKMRQNALRLLASTRKLWPWDLYPPQLFAFIISMIITMAILKRVFADNGLVMGLLGVVDLAVAVALLTSAREYSIKRLREAA